MNPIQKKGFLEQEIPLNNSEAALPLLSRLDNPEIKERSWACSAISNIIASCTEGRLYLLKNGLVSKLIDRISDDSVEVVVEATGALRNLAIEEGYSICMDMYRKNVLAPLQIWQTKIVQTLDEATEGKNVLETYEDRSTFSCLCAIAENISSLLVNLGETTSQVIKVLNQKNTLVFLSRLLIPEAKIPQSVQEMALQAFFTLTDDNDDGIITWIQNSSDFALKTINQIYLYFSYPSCLVRVYSIGIIYNIYQSGFVNKKMESVVKGISLFDSFIPEALPILSDLLPSEENYRNLVRQVYDKDTYFKTKKDDLTLSSELLVIPATLELISSMTSLLQSLADGTDELEEQEDSLMEDEDLSYMDDMSNVVNEDENLIIDEIPSNTPQKGNFKLVEYMLDHVLPKVITYCVVAFEFSSEEIPSNLSNYFQEVGDRTIECLNNISWSCNSVFVESSEAFTRWKLSAGKILQWIFQTIFLRLGLGVWPFSSEGFTTACSLLWSVSKPFPAEIQVLSVDDISTLILFSSTHGSLEAQSRLLGAFGSLGRCGNIQINQLLGQTLMSCVIASDPNPLLAVEALNAIFDVYGDKSYPYDAPVFKGSGYLSQLSEALPRLKNMVKKIDRRREKHLRFRAEEALENLESFIDYKHAEYAS